MVIWTSAECARVVVDTTREIVLLYTNADGQRWHYCVSRLCASASLHSLLSTHGMRQSNYLNTTRSANLTANCFLRETCWGPNRGGTDAWGLGRSGEGLGVGDREWEWEDELGATPSVELSAKCELLSPVLSAFSSSRRNHLFPPSPTSSSHEKYCVTSLPRNTVSRTLSSSRPLQGLSGQCC